MLPPALPRAIGRPQGRRRQTATWPIGRDQGLPRDLAALPTARIQIGPTRCPPRHAVGPVRGDRVFERQRRESEDMNYRKAAVIFGIALLAGYSFAQDTVVQTFSGTGGKNTRPFTVKDGWEIQWDAKGDIFQLFLYRADGEMDGVSANQQGSGKGASYQAKGGQFYLQVNALGDWTIKIVQTKGQTATPQQSELHPKADPAVIATFSGSGGQNTRPFATTGPWEIQWDAKGDIFQIFLYTVDGEMDGVPANQQGSGKGMSYQPKAGKYYLQVNAIGNWRINIVPVQ